MEIKEILSNLFRDQRLNDCIAKMSNPNESQDLKQDVFIVLLTKDPEVIISLHENKTLIFYTIAIIKNLSRTNKRKPVMVGLSDIPEELEYEEENNYSHLLDELPKSKNGFPYFKEVFKIVARCGSDRVASRLTGIPRTSIQRDINFIKNYLVSKG